MNTEAQRLRWLVATRRYRAKQPPKVRKGRRTVFEIRATRRQSGLCRDCPQLSPTAVLCVFCYAKAYQRRPDALDQFNAQKRALKHETYAPAFDRRQHGTLHRALDWALQVHTERSE